LKPERTRELILDFAVTAFGRERNPQQAVLIAAIPAAIRAAIEAGWRPDSRGRTFRFAVPGPETALAE
jgi:hypothetical protein